MYIISLRALRFLSTPSGWRATCLHLRVFARGKSISIHALRVEGDSVVAKDIFIRHHISIHALRVEGDRPLAAEVSRCGYFYPRPPGGGRRAATACKYSARNFYPRPPGGGRRRAARACEKRYAISIHALRVEGDLRQMLTQKTAGQHFYPRPPGGGRRQTSSTAQTAR